MNKIGNLINQFLYSMFNSILEQFKVYLLGKNRGFLEIQQNQNEYIKAAKRNLLEFETNVIKAIANSNRYPEQPTLKTKMQMNLSDPKNDYDAIDVVEKVTTNQTQSEKLKQSPNLLQQDRKIDIQGPSNKSSSFEIVNTPSFDHLSEHFSEKVEQSKIQEPIEQQKLLSQQAQQVSQVKEEEKSLQNVFSKVGEYIKSALPPSKCDQFKATILEFRNAKYFNIRGHRDKVFEFYKTLLINITQFYRNSDQQIATQPNSNSVYLGEKIIAFLTEDKVAKIKHSLQHYAHSDVKNFHQKLIMFDGLELMMQLIGN